MIEIGQNEILMSDLTRREFIAGATAAALAPGMAAAHVGTAAHSMPAFIKPPRLQEGDQVAIIAPASAVDNPSDVTVAIDNLEKLGFVPIASANILHRWGYLAGTDEQRAEDFNWAIREKSVKGIICFQGGYGTMRMLPLLDYKAFRKNPKVVCGYSDITGLCNALTRKSGVVTFHGPIAQNSFEGFEGENFRKVILEPVAPLEFGTPATLSGRAPEPGPATLRPGIAEGRLVGGNLSLIAGLAGTPYMPDLNQAVLFLEDVNEAPYRIDRMLTTLWLSGKLDQLAGVVFGDFRPPKPQADAQPVAPENEFSTAQVIANFAKQVECPVFTGLFTGHIRDKLTLPIGARVRLDAAARTLTLLETAVR